MIPHPASAMTPAAPSVMPPKPPENDGPPSSTSADGASVKLPEPHWDSVIAAATD